MMIHSDRSGSYVVVFSRWDLPVYHRLRDCVEDERARKILTLTVQSQTEVERENG